MLAPNINQGKALLAWHIFVQKINSEQPIVERRRELRNGNEQIFHTQSKVIPGNVEATGRQIILDYVKSYEHSMLHGFTPDHDADLPSLFTNNQTLADKRTVSDRTIRNHISRLRKVGLISGYMFHGSNHDFELWITPEIIFPDENKCKNNAIQTAKNAENPQPLPPQCTNFPHNVAFETTGNIEKENSNVDICGVAAQQGVLPVGEDPCNTFPGNTGPQREGISPEKKPDRGIAAKKQATGAGGAAAARKHAESAVFKSFVEIFWCYAMRVLYPGYEFDETHHKLAKNAIWQGVYGSFRADFSEKEWETYHDEAMQRLDLAATYYRNHQDKYPPMPYAEWVHGSGYFDFENTRGFQATHKWLVQQDVWKHQQRVNDALRRARSDFRLYKQGKAPKRLQEKSPLQLFHFHENKLRRLGKDALQKFYKQHAVNQ